MAKTNKARTRLSEALIYLRTLAIILSTSQGNCGNTWHVLCCTCLAGAKMQSPSRTDVRLVQVSVDPPAAAYPPYCCGSSWLMPCMSFMAVFTSLSPRPLQLITMRLPSGSFAHSSCGSRAYAASAYEIPPCLQGWQSTTGD